MKRNVLVSIFFLMSFACARGQELTEGQKSVMFAARTLLPNATSQVPDLNPKIAFTLLSIEYSGLGRAAQVARSCNLRDARWLERAANRLERIQSGFAKQLGDGWDDGGELGARNFARGALTAAMNAGREDQEIRRQQACDEIRRDGTLSTIDGMIGDGSSNQRRR